MVALARQVLGPGTIRGRIEGHCYIRSGSIVEAELVAAGSTGLEALVEVDPAGAVLFGRDSRVIAPDWRRGISCERPEGFQVTKENAVVLLGTEISGPDKGVVGDGILLLGGVDIHDCREDAIFLGKRGGVWGKRGRTRRIGSRATGGEHCDHVQSGGSTDGVMFEEWSFEDDSEQQLVKLNATWFFRASRWGPVGTFVFRGCHVQFWNWACYWYPVAAGTPVPADTWLWVEGCTFGTKHRTTPGGVAPILNTDHPERVLWSGNRYGQELWVPPFRTGPVPKTPRIAEIGAAVEAKL